MKSLASVDNTLFDEVFEETNSNTINLNDLKDMSVDLVDMTNDSLKADQNVTLRTNSSCSSRSSHTNEDEDEDEEEGEKEPEVFDSGSESKKCNDSEKDEWTDDDEEDDDEVINAVIPKFPVQIIGMENCETTMDDLITENELEENEWLSALMQIIMNLIVYQKAFNFTHNDLHTNNVMYVKTDKKCLWYRYKKKVYRVPTFGRIFKIIDFGRSIFKFNGKIFCSDSFQSGGDAATQYNTEPYFNEKKPRL